MPEIDIDHEGFRELARVYDRVRHHAEELRPLGQLVRRRWVEGERRLFARRPWQPKTAATRKRYRYPIRHMADDAMHRGSPSSRTMELTGLGERTLTTEHSIGMKDFVSIGRKGGLDVEVGIKQNSPVGYLAITDQSARGSRPRRKVVVMDDRALRDSTGDALEYLLSDVRVRS